MLPHPETRRSVNQLPPAPSEIIMNMDVGKKKLVKTAQDFLHACQAHLKNKGFIFEKDIQMFLKGTAGIPKNRILLTFPSMACSRGFYYPFRDYVWTNARGTQRFTIQLYNYQFQMELQDRSKRATAAREVTPQTA